MQNTAGEDSTKTSIEPLSHIRRVSDSALPGRRTKAWRRRLNVLALIVSDTALLFLGSTEPGKNLTTLAAAWKGTLARKEGVELVEFRSLGIGSGLMTGHVVGGTDRSRTLVVPGRASCCTRAPS